MLKIEHCSECQEPEVAFIMSNGERLCSKCASRSLKVSRAANSHFKSKIYPVTKIDLDCHLDMIIAQIMAFFITNGLSVRQCACQLGITHATVYSKLRKAGLMKPTTQTDCILNPHIGDFRSAGGLGKEYRVIQITDRRRKLKKSVTPISGGASDLRNPRGKSISESSNTGKD